ncbi:MAG: hypothetical protein HY858_14375 [Candidatus Solibacter usitatus]|nr:hypothetical protein [Candidatus Solibacter usitatus]
MSRQTIAATVVVLLSLTWGAPQPVKALPTMAYSFMRYMSAIDRSGQELGFWDKVTYSLALAGSHTKKAAVRQGRS